MKALFAIDDLCLFSIYDDAREEEKGKREMACVMKSRRIQENEMRT